MSTEWPDVTLKRRTWDTFLFCDELDMLQCRLEHLQEVPGLMHVLVESSLDHQGNPKPLLYADNKSRFAAWSDRIIHLVAEVPGADQVPDPWVRERIQRENVRAGLADAAPDDLVLLCDVDEIPSPYALSVTPDDAAALSMRLAMFAVDWVYPEETRIAIAGLHRNLSVKSFWQVRDNGFRSWTQNYDGCGWHFTWLGGPDAIWRKASQFCHLELRDMILAANERGELYEQGMTWHGMGAYPPPRPENRQLAATVDESWPAYIRERRCPPEWFRPQHKPWCGDVSFSRPVDRCTCDVTPEMQARLWS